VTARRIRVQSSALGTPQTVTVWVYDTVEQMRAAGKRYNGNDNPDAYGLTQACYSGERDWVEVIVRLARGHLGTEVISHEMHHAATAIYGTTVPKHISAWSHFTHHNEPYAHLYSQLLRRLVDRLYALGYYAQEDQ